ncbi:thermonuclease family protein [Candidatus Pacearchaeota archaeon]|nr:thermonuclease family protein [Candidatus Pacearchaeota archaeon]
MNKKTKHILALSLFLLGIFLAIYPFLDLKLQGYLINHETAFIDRVIDGDTVESNDTSIRLLGINTPERGEKYYLEAKEFLEELVLNKTVRLEFGKEREDRYGRTLAYIYIGNENINLKLVEEGYANFYFPSGKDIHYNEFMEAWEKCNENLCEISRDVCANCIKLTEFDYNKETLIFENICNFNCELTSWEIKDEGRKKFIFPEFTLKSLEKIKIIVGEKSDENNLYWENQNYVWTDSGDTLFLRDSSGGLVLWRSY